MLSLENVVTNFEEIGVSYETLFLLFQEYIDRTVWIFSPRDNLSSLLFSLLDNCLSSHHDTRSFIAEHERALYKLLKRKPLILVPHPDCKKRFIWFEFVANSKMDENTKIFAEYRSNMRLLQFVNYVSSNEFDLECYRCRN